MVAGHARNARIAVQIVVDRGNGENDRANESVPDRVASLALRKHKSDSVAGRLARIGSDRVAADFVQYHADFVHLNLNQKSLEIFSSYDRSTNLVLLNVHWPIKRYLDEGMIVHPAGEVRVSKPTALGVQKMSVQQLRVHHLMVFLFVQRNLRRNLMRKIIKNQS